MKQVEATKMGVYAGSRRRKGERFAVNDGESASWYEDVPGVATPLDDRFAENPDKLKKSELIELGQSIEATVDESQTKAELIEVIQAKIDESSE